MAHETQQARGGEWAALDDWERHRAVITRLYSSENRTLKEVIQIMEDGHSFYATPKMYKHRFKRWGLAKYSKAYSTKEVSTFQAKKKKLDRGAESGPALRTTVETELSKELTRRTRRAHPAKAHPVDVLSLHATARVQSGPRLHVGITSPFYREESTYHAIKDYYDASFSSLFTWTQTSPSTGIVQVKPSVTQNREQLQDLHSRFRIAMNKLSGPRPLDPANLAEGIKIMRVCFARLPDVLADEDPILINHVLDLIRRVQESGHTFIETQLRRHISWLAKSPGQPKSTSLLSHILRIELPLDRYHRSLLTEIAVNAFQQYLGPFHFETLQLEMWLIFNREEDPFLRGYILRQLYSRLESGEGVEVFDHRHLDMLMNLASHHFRSGEPEITLNVVNSVFSNPSRLALLERFHEILYSFYWLAGKALGKQDNHAEAEVHFRKALSVAKQKLDDDEDDDSAYLSGMTALESNLRDQNKLDDANGVLAMRQAYIRETLEKVGEEEGTD